MDIYMYKYISIYSYEYGYKGIYLCYNNEYVILWYISLLLYNHIYPISPFVNNNM